MGRGIFIAFKGVDCTGKTSLCDGLVEQFIDETYYLVEHFEFPQRHLATGRILDCHLKKEIELDDHVLHHLFSAIRWEVSNLMKQMPTNHTPVFIDCYAVSGIAYSAAKKTLSL